MNPFLLKIFFSGLIAFVPNPNGKEMTILLLDTHMRGGGIMAEHRPLLLARAGACDKDCGRPSAAAATFLFPDASSPADAARGLAGAIDQGAVWELNNSILSLNLPQDGVRFAHAKSVDGKALPDTSVERADFRWVARLGEIDPSIGPIDPAVFSDHPPKGLIVARLKLTSGEVSTRSLIQVDGNVVPIDFRPLAGGQARYVRAAASWVGVEVRVPADHLVVTEKNFDTGKQRVMSLTPSGGVIELAVLNISAPVQPQRTGPPQPGTHFQRFYELAQHPPAADKRAVPQVSRVKVPQRSWDVLHPEDDSHRKSALVDKVFPGSRSPYDQILCPMSQYP